MTEESSLTMPFTLGTPKRKSPSLAEHHEKSFCPRVQWQLAALAAFEVFNLLDGLGRTDQRGKFYSWSTMHLLRLFVRVGDDDGGCPFIEDDGEQKEFLIDKESQHHRNWWLLVMGVMFLTLSFWECRSVVTLDMPDGTWTLLPDLEELMKDVTLRQFRRVQFDLLAMLDWRIYKYFEDHRDYQDLVNKKVTLRALTVKQYTDLPESSGRFLVAFMKQARRTRLKQVREWLKSGVDEETGIEDALLCFRFVTVLEDLKF